MLQEILNQFKAEAKNEISKNDLLAQYGDKRAEGKIEAYNNSIELITNIINNYSEVNK